MQSEHDGGAASRIVQCYVFRHMTANICAAGIKGYPLFGRIGISSHSGQLVLCAELTMLLQTRIGFGFAHGYEVYSMHSAKGRPRCDAAAGILFFN